MAILRPRSRLVYYRISEEEFEKVSCLCKEGAARSLSDFTRQAVLRLLEERAEGPDSLWKRRLRELERVIAELNRMVAQLAQVSPPLARQKRFRTEDGQAPEGRAAFEGSSPQRPNLKESRNGG